MEVIDISKIIDLTNQKFGKLTVIKKTENPNSKKKRTYWLCICDCGESSIVDTTSLKSGKQINVGNVLIMLQGKQDE